MTPYRLVLHEEQGYLHAEVSGDHTPDNAKRFLEESYRACVGRGYSALLLEMNLSGPSLESGTIFGVLQSRSPQGSTLRKIAYVDASQRDPEKMRFAETVAKNRGVNVRLFRALDDAKQWMAEDQRKA